MGLHIPGLAHRGIAVVRLRGVLTQIDTGRLNALRRRILATDPQLVIIDLGGLRSWDESGQAHLADIAAYLTDRGGRMVLSGVGAHLRRTDPRMAALEAYADVPSALAAGKTMPRPRRAQRMRWRWPPISRRAELLRHAYHPMPSQAAQIAAAREWARAVLGRWEVSGDADPVTAGLSELAANAVAYGLTDTVEITLRLWRNPDDTLWLTTAIHDANSAPPLWRTPTAAVPRRGWGLLIMAAHAHSHGWYPDDVPGKTVWFARRFHPQASQGDQHRAPPDRL